jgi:hypothetical protein
MGEPDPAVLWKCNGFMGLYKRPGRHLIVLTTRTCNTESAHALTRAVVCGYSE